MRNIFNSVGWLNRVILLLPILMSLFLAACDERSPTPTVTVTANQAAAYPAPTNIPSVPAYPVSTTTPTLTQSAPTIDSTPIAPSPRPSAASFTVTSQSFLPSVQLAGPTETATPSPIPLPSVTPTLDFETIRAELQASGQDLAFSKIGFHVTTMNDAEEQALYGYLRRLDQAGVPFFLKSASNAEPLLFAQQLMVASGVPHTLVYRSTAWDVPEYELPAEQAADLHWQRHRDIFPPELDPSLVWIETLNEVDKTQSEWLGSFALRTAELAMADGFRWAAFGWASGEPEPEGWQTPAMLAFLRLAGSNPDRLAIALHEYSFLSGDIAHLYPFKVGRFLELFRIVDERGIPRPTVLISEWGWSYVEVPPVEQAMRHIHWANTLYAPFPQVKGAAIWNLGSLGGRRDLSPLVTPYLGALTEYSLSNYFSIPLRPNQAPPDPELYRP